MTLQQILDLENEIKLIETKVKQKLASKETRDIIETKTGIDKFQLVHFKSGRRTFSIKRLFKIAKILIKENL